MNKKPKIFQTTDEINEYLLKNTTPLDYCKSVIADMISQINAYLTGDKREKDFDHADFFLYRQCEIFLKNRTVFHWTIDTPLAAICIPDPDDIEYIMFHSIPKRMTLEEAEQLGISPEVYESEQFNGFCNLSCYIDEENHFEYKFDSIHGAFHEDDEYGKEVFKNRFHSGNYRLAERWWPEYQVSLDITDHGFHGTYFANFMDGYIGALIAEQVLLSNKPENRSLKYGSERYQSLVAFAPIPIESVRSLYDKDFMLDAYSYCSTLDHRLELSAAGRLIYGDKEARVEYTCEFIYLYLHSLLHTAPAENFSIIGPIFTEYLKNSDHVNFFDPQTMISDIRKVCSANYYQKPDLTAPNTPLEHFQAAVWAVVNSDSYLSALTNILEFVQYQHSAKLAVILTGIFAGIYYQHYRIPQKYLTENRYYGKFSAAIIPLDHKVYREFANFTQEEKDNYL